MKNLDTQLCKEKSIRNGQWVYGYSSFVWGAVFHTHLCRYVFCRFARIIDTLID